LNIFFLDKDPKQAAIWLKDAHILKMGIEAAQMLSTAWHCLNPGDVNWFEGVPFIDKRPIYKRAYENHPMTRWVRASVGNYSWCYRHGMAIMDEYQYRWGNASNIVHVTRGIIYTLQELPDDLPDGEFTTPPLCMPEQYHGPDYIEAYRKYYNAEKLQPNSSNMHVYKGRERPEWATLL
jgi:hypothetical protein